MLQINIIRKKVSENSVLGELTVWNDGVDFLYRCYTLENRSKSIPVGRYKVILSFSPKFNRILPLVCDVPNRSGIRIHTGNYYSDSSGCILVGEDWTTSHRDYMLTGSKKAFTELFDHVSNKGFVMELNIF